MLSAALPRPSRRSYWPSLSSIPTTKNHHLEKTGASFVSIRIDYANVAPGGAKALPIRP
ncbi:hypothetical protein PZN02_006114 (plasmid) [Sinorhizobium garamanticum]|uniref:Uncharacterized protein n=1 Tax=Sinorhizobium garamanticum TaxID=680247 RepID=A0ABY8DLN3_9HYPH|nr:hypothetical protein [Sinorhizobium garamanticum]WEX91789.1 hypothetical protein PZN02_006114 [Sinorhizobium garamanticum]